MDSVASGLIPAVLIRVIAVSFRRLLFRCLCGVR